MLRTLVLGASLLVAAPAFACPMADMADYTQSLAAVQAADGTKVDLVVDGMECGACSAKVTAALKALEGVKEAAVDYQSGKAEIAYDAKKVDTDKMLAAIKSAGFSAKLDTAS